MLRVVDSFDQATCLSANAFFIFPKKLPWIKNPHLQLPTMPGRRLSMKRHMKSPLVEADKKSSETSFELTEMGLFQNENSSTKLHLEHFVGKKWKMKHWYQYVWLYSSCLFCESRVQGLCNKTATPKIKSWFKMPALVSLVALLDGGSRPAKHGC